MRWLCKVAERQMLRPSFVPPPEIRRLRDLTRYRCDLVETRTAEKQRVEKLLEDAQIKLSVVASDIFGVSGREMMAALIAGQRDAKVLAQLARARMRGKISQLQEAFTGYFTDHHGYLPAKMLGRVGMLSADITEGSKKAIVAVGRSILVIIWHLLSDPEARYHDLGSDFHDKRINPERKKRTHVHQLDALGYKVTLELVARPAPVPPSPASATSRAEPWSCPPVPN